MNFTTFGVASGVSSLSACSAGDEFSGPEESKLKSKGFRGVVKEGARYGGCSGSEGGCEKRNG